MSTGFAGEATTTTGGDWGATAQDFANNSGFDFDTEGVDTTKVGNETSFAVDKPGKYHFEVSVAENKLDIVDKDGHHVAPHVLIGLTVLHTVPNQSPEGSRMFVHLYLADKGGGPRQAWQTEQTINLLEGMGLVKRSNGLIIDPSNGTTKLNWETWADRARGRQLVGDVRMSKTDPTRLDPRTQKPYEPRPELSYGRGLYQVTDEKVKDVPKNVVALNAYLKATGQGGQVAAGQVAATTTGTTATAPEAKVNNTKPAAAPVQSAPVPQVAQPAAAVNAPTDDWDV